MRTMEHAALELLAGDGTAPDELRAALTIAPSHPLFAGHFPGDPIVPGVLLLDAVREAWQRASGQQCDLVAVEAARWHQALRPGERGLLAAHWVAAGDGVSIAGEWRTATTRIATFALRLRVAVTSRVRPDG